jgi:1,6-anhydro-N-acetylmuramate kinase
MVVGGGSIDETLMGMHWHVTFPRYSSSSNIGRGADFFEARLLAFLAFLTGSEEG